MPTSPYVHIQNVVNYLIETKPLSILDIGLGNGKLGFIARDLLDVMLGERYRKEQWRIRIDGIEIFPEYIQDHQKAIYDRIYIGDAFEILPRLDVYEMIMVGDVLEHFDKPKAWRFLEHCMAKTEKHLLLNIPIGPEWEQDEIYGNPHERHRSVWTWKELEPFVWQYKIFDIHPGAYGSMLIRKEDYTLYRYRQFVEKNKKA